VLAGPGGLDLDALFPRGGGLGAQMQRVDARMVQLQVAPEQPAQIVGQAAQGGEVQGGLPFGQVGDEQVTHRAALDAALADQFLDGRLPPPAGHPDRRRGRGVQHPGRVQELVEVRAAGLP